MGFRKYENRPLSYHLATPLSIGEMRRRGWVVMARCRLVLAFTGWICRPPKI